MLVRTLGNGPDNLFPIKDLHIFDSEQNFSVSFSVSLLEKQETYETITKEKFLQLNQVHCSPLSRYRTGDDVSTKVSDLKYMTLFIRCQVSGKSINRMRKSCERSLKDDEV